MSVRWSTRSAARLFRGHVGHRADHRRPCTPSTVIVSVLSDDSAPDQFRQAEVEDLDAAVGRDEQVARLDVAMDDAAIVGGGETAWRSAARSRRPCGPASGRPAMRSRSVSPSRSSVTMYEDPLLDADVVHREDVRMIQPAGSPRFLLESAPTIRIAAKTPPAGP